MTPLIMPCCDPSVDIIYNLNSYLSMIAILDTASLSAPPRADTSHRPHPLSAGHWASGTHFSLGVAKLKQENIVMILISICYHLVVMRPRDTEISNENIFPVMI